MKVDKFKTFLESSSTKINSLKDLDDVLLALEDIKGINVYYEYCFKIANVKSYISSNYVHDYYKTGKKIITPAVKIEIMFDKDRIIREAELFFKVQWELYEEINNLLRKLKSIFKVGDIKIENCTIDEISIIFEVDKNNEIENLLSFNFLEKFIYNREEESSDVEFITINKDTFCKIKKELDYKNIEDFKNNIIKKLEEKFGKQNLEYNLIEENDFFTLKNFKIKNII